LFHLERIFESEKSRFEIRMQDELITPYILCKTIMRYEEKSKCLK